jgi:hypothetical protein
MDMNINKSNIDENIKVPPQLNDYILKGFEKGVSEKKKDLKYKRIKIFKRTAIASVLGVTLLGVANPAMASKIPFVGSIFDEIEKNIIFPGNYSQYATSVNETVKSKGISITISEIVCDGQSLSMTYKVESDKSLKNMVENNQLMLTDSYNVVSFSNQEVYPSGSAGLEGKLVDDNTFIGVRKFNLSALNSEIPNEFEFKTKTEVMGKFAGDESVLVYGTWAFKVPVKVNKDLKHVINLNYDLGNDFKINSLSITPFDITLNSNLLLEGNISNEGDNEVSYEVKLYNEDGREIPMVSGVNNEKDGFTIRTFKSASKDSKNLKLVIKKMYVKRESAGGEEYTYKVEKTETILDKIVPIN